MKPLTTKQKQEIAEVICRLEKVFCATGPGGGVDPTCGSGKRGGGPAGLSAEGKELAEKFAGGQAWKGPITEMMEAHDLTWDDYEEMNEALYKHNIASGPESDKRLGDLWEGDSPASRAMHVMSAWNEFQIEYKQKKGDFADDPEVIENVKARLKKKEDAGTPWSSIQGYSTDGQYFSSYKEYDAHLDRLAKGDKVFYRAGAFDKKAISVTDDPRGATSGSSQFKPDRLTYYQDMKDRGYRMLSGARGMVGLTSSQEREFIWLKVD